MKNFLLLCLLLFSCGLFGQGYRAGAGFWEVGALIGAANYSGDLVEKGISLKNSRPSLGVFARYHISHTLAVKSNLAVQLLAGDDKHNPNNAYRTFKFTNPLVEWSVVGEYIPYTFEIAPVRSPRSTYLSPYVFIGGGLMYSSAKPVFYGTQEDRERYGITALPENGKNQEILFSTPFGVGLRLNYESQFSIGIEAGARPVFSDRLDGFSTNANPELGDWYHVLNLTVSYFLNDNWRPARRN